MPVRVLVIGGGSIGERHLRCFQQVGCQVALCETSDARRQELQERYGLAEVYGSIDEGATRLWDAAVICTPAHLHVEHAEQLAPATAALLIEKPLCTRLEDVPRLQAATAGKVVQVAYVMRSHPAVERARALLAAGQIGQLHQVTVVAGQHFPTFRPAYRDIYYARHETGGGAIQDAATHLFDLVQTFAGRFDWIFCDYAHQELAGVEVEDTVHLVGRAGGGRTLVALALNQFMAPNEIHLQLNGSQGSLGIRFHEHSIGLCLQGDPGWTWTEPLVSDRDDLFRAQADSFLAAVTGSQPPRCTLGDGVAALRVNLAALASGRQRIAIDLPADESVAPPQSAP